MHALGQVAHLIGYHGKTAAHFPGAGGFNGGVQGQQVGLLGNAVNFIDDVADLLAVGGQALDHFGGLLYASGQCRN